MGIDRTHIVVLNFDGIGLMAECLPTVVEAARRASVPCPVSVVDNGSADGSAAWLAERWPGIGLIREPNRGLASFNAALGRMDEPAVILLNNDVKLDPGAVDPLIRALDRHADALFSAPKCWDFAGSEYEGMRTRVRTRFGLVQGMSRVPGYESAVDRPCLTAAAGPVLAVDRARFLELGGYDALYFPGRIEDLDLGFAGWMAGYRGYYVPESVAYHRGFGSFGPAFGRRGCDHLAARNSVLFAWKNLGGRRLLAHLAWLGPRLAHGAMRGSGFVEGLRAAWAMRSGAVARRRSMAVGRGDWVRRQEAFFETFGWSSAAEVA